MRSDPHADGEGPVPRWTLAVAAAGVVAVTLAAFAPVVSNGFLDWGDQQDLVGNSRYRSFSPASLVWMLTTIQMGHYQPLAWLTFALDHALWGMAPRGYHLTSLLLHAGCALATFVLLLHLLRLSVRGATEHPGATSAAAAVGALLFSVHPLRVESVAWATERRGPLTGLCFVLSVAAYLRYVERARRGAHAPASAAYRWSVAWFLAALLAKELSLTLPAVLLVLDAYPLRRWLAPGATTRFALLVREKLPFLALAAIWCVVAVLSARQSQVARSLASYGIVERLAQATYGLAFYVRKTFVPTDLLPIYSIPTDLDPWTAPYIGSAVAVAALGLLLFRVRRRYPAAPAIAVTCLVLLGPVLGLAQTGRQLAADRYTYLPAVALSAGLAGLLLHGALRWSSRLVRCGLAVVAVGVIALLSAVTQAQVRHWRDPLTLWSYTQARAPDCPVANTNLGKVLVEEGRFVEAEHHLARALAADPMHLEASNNLGVALAQQGRLAEAVERWEAVLAIEPRDAAARANLERARRLVGAAPRGPAPSTAPR